MRSAVVRPLRVTLICPVWQAAQVMSSSSSFSSRIVVPCVKPTGSPSGLLGRLLVDEESVAPHAPSGSAMRVLLDHGISRLRNQL